MDLYLCHHQFKSCFFTASFFKDAFISRKSTSQSESVDILSVIQLIENIFRFENLTMLNVVVLFREMCRLRKEILTHKLEIQNNTYKHTQIGVN